MKLKQMQALAGEGIPKSFNWVVDGGAWPTIFEKGACPFCCVAAVCALPPPLAAAQPDDTTHVCHPSFGGCNHGFALEEE